MKAPMCLILFLAGLLAAGAAAQLRAGAPVESWITTDDLRKALAPGPPAAFVPAALPARDRIEIDDAAVFQTILGLGSSLEPATCWNFWRMAQADRDALMERIVDPGKGIGMNLMRICIGTPDFTGDPWYSYCDLPPGETDPELSRFSIDRDRAYILPVLQLARQKNPELLFFASPWSPPGWMKSTGTMIGGRVLPQWYPAYARYFVRFIQAYEAEGIPIHAVTVQNEAGVDRAKERDPKWHYPSCRWTGEEEREFIRDHLGPALRAAGMKTRIWCYDHNYNERAQGDDPGLDYPRAILRDARAAAFVGGVAFHGYAGRPSSMSLFREEFPQVPIHFTEGSVFGVKGAVELIELLRNWATSYNAWVLMLDDKSKPNNGPFDASDTPVQLDTATLEARQLLDYYVYGQFMKFIPRGAVRVESRALGRAPAHVAFRAPDGRLVLVAANPAARPAEFQIQWRGESCAATLSGRSVGTWVWAGPAAGLRLATFTADVTVPMGHGMMGGAWLSTSVADPLEAHGLVLLGAGAPIVSVAVDWCEIRNDAFAAWQTALAAAAGTTPERVMVCAVHQHDAPVADLAAESILRARGARGTVCDPEFHAVALERAAAALAAALPGARRVTHVGIGQAPVERIASNRRYLGHDGAVRFDRTSATRAPAAIAAPEGLVDPWLKTLSFWDGDTPLAAVSAYATHPMSYYGKGEISADFPGLARRRRQQEMPEVKQIYVSGCSGNITAGKYNDGAPENRAALAERLHHAMAAAWDATRRFPIEQVDFRVARLTLEPRGGPGFSVEELEQKLGPETPPFQQCLAAMGLSWHRRADAGRPIEIPLIDFGVAQWLLLPGEAYVEYQLAAQRMRSDAFVLVAGYGDGATGYIPTARHIAEGDGNLADWCWVAPGAEARLLEAIRQLVASPDPTAPPWRRNLPIAHVKKELYARRSAPRAAPLVSVQQVGPGPELREVRGVERESDVGEEIRARWSPDNGRTWSEFVPVQPSNKIDYHGVAVWEGECATAHDPRSGRLVQLWLRQIERDGVYHNFTYVRTSTDQGRSWSAPAQLRYEAGAEFDPAAPLDPEFLNHNEGYPGNSILRRGDGSLLACLAHANAPGDPDNDRRPWRMGSALFLGMWDVAREEYRWEPGARVEVAPSVSARGLMEPDAAELADGRLLVVWRGSTRGWDGTAATTPGCKFFSLSTDGGRTLGAPAPWTYSDGSSFYSPSSYHRFLRHGGTGKLYWVGNIAADAPEGNSPRYPLVIAEIDEAAAAPRRDSVTAIDDRQPGQGDIQFSNFSLFEDRQTRELLLHLTTYGQEPDPRDWATADNYRYALTLR